MKQNKFRIFDNQGKRFVSNDSSLHCFSHYLIDALTGDVYDAVGTIDKDHVDSGIRRLSRGEDYYLDGRKLIKSSRYVVQQFTGLKDTNGVEIYEGDIVFVDEDNWMVVFEEGLFGLKINKDDKISPLYQYPDCGVIGNILENPELIVEIKFNGKDLIDALQDVKDSLKNN